MENKFVKMMESFSKDKGFVKFQIESYNEFIIKRVSRVLQDI